MKKLIVFVSLLAILASPGTVNAADMLFRMLHADEVESFRKDQDAIIVGQLIDKREDKFVVKVLKTISGKVKSDTILVSDDFNYGWGEQELPTVSDFCVMSLKMSESYYRKAWGVFKADSGDYKTLKLVYRNTLSSGLIADLACIEWYVNSGGTENDFSFKSGTAYVKRTNNTVIQIYPKPTVNNAAKMITDETQVKKAEAKTESDTSNSKTVLYWVLAIAFIIVVEVLTTRYLNSRKKNKF